jgi:hypothetical protein
MDEISFRALSPGTEITMIKYVRGQDRDGIKEANQ